MFNECLTKNELQFLDHFLRHQSDTKNNPNLTSIHGFLSGVLTAPFLFRVSHFFFIHEIYGVKKQTLNAGANYRLWLSKLVYQIKSDLQKNMLSPLLFENGFGIPYKEASWALIKEWSLGYLYAAELDFIWREDDEGFAMVMPIGILADEFELVGTPDEQGQIITDNTRQKVLARESLLKIIDALYDYWKEQRRSYLNDRNKNLH